MTVEHEARVRDAVAELADALLAAMRASAGGGDTPERLLDLTTTAERMGVTRSTLYQRVLPDLRVVRVGRRVLVPESAIREYVDARTD